MAPAAYGVSYDGEGHYSLLAQTRTNPGFARDRGLNEGILQNFRLLGEVRSTDTSSFFLEFTLFEDPRNAYLGDRTRPEKCSTSETETSFAPSADCEESQQNSGEPRYVALQPLIRQAYAQFAFDRCLLQAGRRSRHWGIGIFLSGGNGPFDVDQSVYDGVSCKINIQKSQTMAFTFGYDKITETGSSKSTTDTTVYGSTNRGDDLSQIFLALEYDDRKVAGSSGFSQQVGVYFANVYGGNGEDETTDIKFADLYTSFYLSNFIFKNELLFRLGQSTDPSWARLGGAYPIPTTGSVGKKPVSNDVNAIAFAGSFEYLISQSGSVIGPRDFYQGDAESHSVFIDWAYAPGDKQGYLVGNRNNAQYRKDKKASAVAFNRNFKPGLILFNDLPSNDEFRIDGIYDPGRFMNASLGAIGYRYRSLQSGNFELKLLGASLNESIDTVTRDEILAREESDIALGNPLRRRPVGFSNKNLGLELDLKYDIRLSRSIELGAAGAIAIPGEAFKPYRDANPIASFLIQSHVAFYF